MPTPTSLNAQFADLAISLLQPYGILVGSAAWEAGGAPAATFSTGYHEAEGFTHRQPGDLLDPNLAPALKERNYRLILSNAAARPDKYTDARDRMDGYGPAGRPVGWAWAPGLDGGFAHASGGAQFPGGIVYGFDGGHALLNPLTDLALHGDPTILLTGLRWGGAPLPTMSAVDLARAILWFEAEAVVGLCRPGSWSYLHSFDGRWGSRVLDALNQCFQAGQLLYPSSEDALGYARNLANSNRQAPGCQPSTKWGDYEPPLTIGTLASPPTIPWNIPEPWFLPVQQLGYLAPALYWAGAPLKADDVVMRLATWAVEITDDDGGVPWGIQIHGGESLDDGTGKPIQSLAALLDEGRVTKHYFTYTKGVPSRFGPHAASMYVALVLAENFGLVGAGAKANAIYAREGGDPNWGKMNRRWFVDLQRRPV